MVTVRSQWAQERIVIGGALTSREWDEAGSMRIPAGILMVKNDADYLYLALDMVADRGNDPGTDDYFWLTFDIDGNRAITPRQDVNYGIPRNQPNNLGRQYYLGPGRWTGLLNEDSKSQGHIGFGASPNSSTHHRVWEMRLSLEELNVDLAAADSPPVLNFGVRISSTNPRFTFDYPANFYQDFAGLHQIILARSASANYPEGMAGAVIGGVGLIPASQIVDGYATTDPSYYHYVDDAAFGGRLNLIGNRATMQSLWGAGARKYEIRHRVGTSGAFTPLSAAWTNYRWNGSQYVLEHFGPDSDTRYPLSNPAEDYSIDDLLLQWQSVGTPAGLHQFQAVFFTATGAPVAAPSQTLTLMIDNNQPQADLADILHNGRPIQACAIEQMTSNTDGIRLRVTAFDAAGHLRLYRIRAFWGDSQSQLIVTDNYANHRDPSHRWEGVSGELIPASEWVPPVTCAYQFRVEAYPRVTNGYNWLGGTTDTRHVTLIKPGVSAAVEGRFSDDLVLGMVDCNQAPASGEAPEKLGNETFSAS
jgi:hypothetical protein